MTGFALGMHQRLEKEGITAKGNPDEYYQRVDARMRETFPDQFEDSGSNEPADRKRATNVVAPATRSTSPNKVKLTKTQVALAKRMGVPLKLYAQYDAAEKRKRN